MYARLLRLRTISPAELHRRIRDSEPVTVLDVNAPDRWAQAHVPGARNLDPVSYGEGELPPDRSATLVFYCSNRMCSKAPRAASRARKMGYRNVHVMSAGIGGWRTARLPTDAGS